MPSSPLEIRVGATGAGLFVGCGAGLGVVTPVSLHAIPVLGQLAASLAASLGSMNHVSGGLFSAARSRVRKLGVRNMDMGFGCGVMVGYGYGAGFFVRPDAMQGLASAAQAAGHRLLAALPQPVQTAVRQQQQRQQQQMGGWGGGGSGWRDPAVLSSSSVGPPGQQWAPTSQQQQQRQADSAESSPPSQQRQQQQQGALSKEAAASAEEVVELSKLVLRQQNRLAELDQQVQGLQAAVCRLDAGAPGCKST